MKLPENIEKLPNFILIIIEEWKNIVKKLKKCSALSIFSHQNYVIHKCMIESERINSILTRYYNLIISNCYFLIWWLKILDIIIEKGKSPTIGKLQIIQLIEADLQLIIRIFLKYEIKRKIEKDLRILKANYGSRSKYSIENRILEK